MNATKTLRQAAFSDKLLLLLGCICLLSSFGACVRAQQQDVLTKEVRHTNGLVVQVPEQMFVEEVGDVLYINPRPPDREHRDTEKMSIKFVGKPLPSEAKDAKVWRKDSRVVYYRYDMDYGGSQDRFVIDAWEAVPGGHVDYRYKAEHGSGEPLLEYGSYPLCWQVIEGTSFKPADK